MLKTTQQSLLVFIGVFFLIFGVDQAIKYAILEGFRYESLMVDIVLVFNKGVAFSLLSFLEGVEILANPFDFRAFYLFNAPKGAF